MNSTCKKCGEEFNPNHWLIEETQLNRMCPRCIEEFIKNED